MQENYADHRRCPRFDRFDYLRQSRDVHGGCLIRLYAGPSFGVTWVFDNTSFNTHLECAFESVGVISSRAVANTASWFYIVVLQHRMSEYFVGS